MKVSISKIILLSAVLIVLISVSGGAFANAQTEIDKGPAGQKSSSSGSQPIPSSSSPLSNSTPSSSSAVDSNAPATHPASQASDLDLSAPRPAGISASATMNFLFVAGSAFTPRNSTYTYADYWSGGCIYQTGGSPGDFLVDIQLPEGAMVDILRLFVYDSNTGVNSNAWLTDYNGAGNLHDRIDVSSIGSTGYSNSAGYPLFPYAIQTYTYPVVLNWHPNTTGNSMVLCGMRIRYWLDMRLFFLPGVMKQ